jgi:hypothetical protein
VTTRFAIFRHESGGYSTRGPVVPEMTLDEARKEVARLKSAYPYQEFVIMGEIGTVTRSERITVKIESPTLRNRLPKQPKTITDRNVVPLRTLESA